MRALSVFYFSQFKKFYVWLLGALVLAILSSPYFALGLMGVGFFVIWANHPMEMSFPLSKKKVFGAKLVAVLAAYVVASLVFLIGDCAQPMKYQGHWDMPRYANFLVWSLGLVGVLIWVLCLVRLLPRFLGVLLVFVLFCFLVGLFFAIQTENALVLSDLVWVIGAGLLLTVSSYWPFKSFTVDHLQSFTIEKTVMALVKEPKGSSSVWNKDIFGGYLGLLPRMYLRKMSWAILIWLVYFPMMAFVFWRDGDQLVVSFLPALFFGLIYYGQQSLVLSFGYLPVNRNSINRWLMACALCVFFVFFLVINFLLPHVEGMQAGMFFFLFLMCIAGLLFGPLRVAIKKDYRLGTIIAVCTGWVVYVFVDPQFSLVAPFWMALISWGKKGYWLWYGLYEIKQPWMIILCGLALVLVFKRMGRNSARGESLEHHQLASKFLGAPS